jgi:hypothetical protein
MAARPRGMRIAASANRENELDKRDADGGWGCT